MAWEVTTSHTSTTPRSGSCLSGLWGGSCWDGPWGDPGMVPGVVSHTVTRVVPGMFLEMVLGVVFVVLSGLVPQMALGWSP